MPNLLSRVLNYRLMTEKAEAVNPHGQFALAANNHVGGSYRRSRVRDTNFADRSRFNEDFRLVSLSLQFTVANMIPFYLSDSFNKTNFVPFHIDIKYICLDQIPQRNVAHMKRNLSASLVSSRLTFNYVMKMYVPFDLGLFYDTLILPIPILPGTENFCL